VQHKEWFIGGMLSHLCTSLLQQHMLMSWEALEFAMQLESISGLAYASVFRLALGLAQFQYQLASLFEQIKELAKAKASARGKCGACCARLKATYGMTTQ